MRFRSVCICASLGLVVSALCSQNSPKPSNAANAWMMVPFDLRSQSRAVSVDDSKARDAYWDELIGSSLPLSNPSAREHPLPHADADPTAPEFGDLGDGELVIGKFESYQTVLSVSLHSIYTEIGFRVQHVFGHPIAPVQDGQLITLDRPGGTVIAPWGGVVSYAVHPEDMGLQPNHTYLIALGYHESGHFYTGGYKTGGLWDLTDGNVKPGNHLQKYRADHGLSKISGMTVYNLSQFLDDKFRKFYEADGRAR
jgi:hypothetical protein